MIVPIRDLGEFGVITDIDPFDTPPTAWSMGVNARFEDKRIKRGPVFSLTGALATGSMPRYTVCFFDSASQPHTYVCNDDGTVKAWQATHTGISTNTDISISGYTPSTQQTTYTSTIVDDMIFINRADRIPWYAPSAVTPMLPVPTGTNQWDPTWRCKAFRSVAGTLVAINVTKGATNYPTMVKTSDYVSYDLDSAAWVAASNNSATENVLPMLQEPLVDGWPLRDSMILYSTHNCILMEPTYDNFVYAYRMLFTSRGVINQNCVGDIDNTHYVFGNDDIWRHNGYTPEPVARGKVRDFVYDNLVRAQRWQFFVMHNPVLTEMVFCYVSKDPYCAFPVNDTFGYPGCNRAAVYNYRADTWYFYDLPYVTHGNLGSPDIGLTYNDLLTRPYNTVSGSYSSFEDTSKQSVMYVSPAVTGPYGPIVQAVRTFEPVGSVSAQGTLDPTCAPPVYLENSSIDLDNLKMEIRGYKVINSVYPEGRFGLNSPPLNFQFGVADYANSPPPAYSTIRQFDGQTQYKLDYMVAGRFLSIKVTYSGQNTFSLSGLDVDMTVTGSR